MSDPTKIRASILKQFNMAFGPPTRVMGENHHWSLRRLSYVAAVNVLVDAASTGPMVWVFNPHHPDNGVQNVVIRDEAQIGPLIAEIEQSVRQAGTPPPK